MHAVLGAVMAGAGIACVGASLSSHHRLAAIAHAVMTGAMIDVHFMGLLSPVVWAGLLFALTLILGIRLRIDQRDGPPPAGWVLTLLAYPATAAVLVTHTGLIGAGRSAVSESTGSHAAHSSEFASSLILLLPILFATVLAVVTAALAVVTLKRQRPGETLEIGSTAAMLGAMVAIAVTPG